MIRALHRWPGLLALALVTVLALSGAALSVFPAAERIAAPQAEADLTVAALADRIQAVYPGVEQIRRSPSGRITAYWFDQGAPGAAVIDPATGEGVASADPNQARTLAHQPAPLAVPRGWRAHRHGRGGRRDADPFAFRRGAGRAAGGRLAALVRASARAARGPAARRDRPDRRDRPRSVLHHRPLDDGLHLRSSAGRRRHRRPCRPRSAERRGSLSTRWPRCSRRPSPICAS